jgi:hypothetical protein
VSNYAAADKSAQWFAGAYPGKTMTPNCGCLHTTEGVSWPGYGGGAQAPNYTAKPNFGARRLDWRAHFPDEMSARALVNKPGGVETNTANVVQVELIGTCDPKHRVSWGGRGVQFAGEHYVFWPDAPEWALRSLALFLVDQFKRHGTPVAAVPAWKPYPSSYGANGVRMSATAWRAFKGWCGHQHVPENDHGDPGAFPIASLLQLAQQILNPQEDDMTPDESKRLTNVETMLAQLVKQTPEQWMIPDASDPNKRRYKFVPKGTPGAQLVTTFNAMGGNSLQVSIGGVADKLVSGVALSDEAIKDVVDAVVAKLPAGGGANPQQLAEIVADELAARLTG